ncbi:hypothetical protein [Entomomonas asaccharolytica]|uniref:Uncharacterized protein n=1 Tax=Entomomonas asaccharolytica TaxID=2785331 RepID=A0A974NEG8_9GAMM|nr:hypothetical protein [Entomomonas asaccharolytica]QQP85028.1 hypothetical protein JHT90_11610 [Entomomonas asaccharolytica]
MSRYILTLLLFIHCIAYSQEEINIIDANIVNKQNLGIPLEICFKQPFTNQLAAKITIVTKDNLTFSRQDIILSFDYQNKTNCLHLNAGVYLLPKRASNELQEQAKNSLKFGNIKSINIKLSRGHGFYYNPENKITEYSKSF